MPVGYAQQAGTGSPPLKTPVSGMVCPAVPEPPPTPRPGWWHWPFTPQCRISWRWGWIFPDVPGFTSLRSLSSSKPSMYPFCLNNKTQIGSWDFQALPNLSHLRGSIWPELPTRCEYYSLRFPSATVHPHRIHSSCVLFQTQDGSFSGLHF